MALACKICILQKGLRGSEIASLPQNEEELADHMEKVHHMPVTREGETDEEALERFLKKYPGRRPRVAEYGNKLPEKAAAQLFPEWAKTLKWRP